MQLYLVIGGLLVPSAAFEVLTPRWAAFDADFNLLLANRFGWDNENLAYWLPTGAIGIAHLVCAIGLLWTKRWARMGFAISVVAWLIFEALFGPPATYYGRLTYPLEVIGLITSGALLLLAYARGAGAVWFGDDQFSKE